MAGAGVKRGYVHGKSDKTGSSPAEDPVHPMELLATIYHAFGIDPETIVYNHLKQPRELVKAKAVSKFSLSLRGTGSQPHLTRTGQAWRLVAFERWLFAL